MREETLNKCLVGIAMFIASCAGMFILLIVGLLFKVAFIENDCIQCKNDSMVVIDESSV